MRIDIIKYSKIYMKSLTDLNFRKEIKKASSARVEVFLPLYSAINKNYGFVKDGSLLEKVAKYLKMLNNEIKPNTIYKKFLESYKRYNLSLKEDANIDKIISKDIIEFVKKHNLSSYMLIKKFEVNARHANEIINKKKISMSLEKKLLLLKRLKSFIKK